MINTFVPCDRTKDSIKLSDIKPNDSFVNSMICFLSAEGPVKTVYDEDIGETVEESYYYVADPTETEAGVAGWYLQYDYENLGCVYPRNNRAIAAGEGFSVYNTDADEGVIVTLPSAL